MVFVGHVDPKKAHLKRASTIYVEDENFIEDSEHGVNLNATTRCPHCNKKTRPLRINATEKIGTTYPWCGLEHQDIQDEFTTQCPHCKQPFAFGLRYPQ